jgi:hypothetical protein
MYATTRCTDLGARESNSPKMARRLERALVTLYRRYTPATPSWLRWAKVLFIALLPVMAGITSAHSRKIISFENKTHRVVDFENVSIPNSPDNNLPRLVREKHIGFLPRDLTEGISLPLLGFPIGRVGQLIFFADGCRYGSNECLGSAQVVYRDDQHATSIANQIPMVGSARDVGSIRFSRMPDCPPHNHALAEPDDNEKPRNDCQENSKRSNGDFSDFYFTPKIVTPCLVFIFGLLFAICGVPLEIIAFLLWGTNFL